MSFISMAFPIFLTYERSLLLTLDSVSPPLLSCVYVSVVNIHMYEYEHVCRGLWSPEDILGCRSLPPTMFETGFLCFSIVLQMPVARRVRRFPFSVSHFHVWHWDCRSSHSGFRCVFWGFKLRSLWLPSTCSYLRNLLPFLVFIPLFLFPSSPSSLSFKFCLL